MKEKVRQAGRLRRIKILTGTVVEAKKTAHSYKIHLDDSGVEKWFQVENIAAFPRQAELDKRAQPSLNVTSQQFPNSSEYQIIEECIRASNDKITASQVQADQIQRDLAENMWINNLRPIGHVPRDGNCLFHAVAQSVNAMDSTEYAQQEIRLMVVDWLRSNPYTSNRIHLSSFVHDSSWDEYLEGISTTEWGDHICLRAISSIFKVNIEIVSSQNPQIHRIVHDVITTRAQDYNHSSS